MRRRLSTLSVLALVFGFAARVGRCQEDGDSGGGDGSSSNSDSSRDYEYGPCGVSTPEECFAVEATVTDDTGRATECAWVSPRTDAEYCWTDDDGNEQCDSQQSDQAPLCGFCFDIHSDGYEYSSYSCSEIVELYYRNGHNDHDVYCRSEYTADDIPESVRYYCADLGVDPGDRVHCIDAQCGTERENCEGDESADGCNQLLEALQTEVAKWDNCTVYRWEDGNDEDDNWDDMRSECAETCPGDFRDDEDYFECGNLYPYYVSIYCADNETLSAQYEDACDVLQPYGVCSSTYCEGDSCERFCASEFMACYFAEGCYQELQEFEAKLDEEDNFGEDIFDKYTLAHIFEEFCSERESGTCSAEMTNIYDCASVSCLRHSCLTDVGCDSAWDTCIDSEACSDAFQNTFCTVLGCDDERDMTTTSTSTQAPFSTSEESVDFRRRLLETSDEECCSECCDSEGNFDDVECTDCATDFTCESCGSSDYNCCQCCEDDGSIKDTCEGDCDDFTDCDSCSDDGGGDDSSGGDDGYSDDDINECCQCCNEDGDFSETCTTDTACEHDDFDCGACGGGDDNYNSDSSNGDENDDDSNDLIFLMTNYMEWWYTFHCESDNEGDCDNDDFEAVLDCVNAPDSDCAVEFEMTNTCLGRCTGNITACFEIDECGTEFDEYWTHQQTCDEGDSDSDDSENSCNAWRYNDDGDEIYDEEVSYQQYQCWRDGGCTPEYYSLWTCIWPCFMYEGIDEDRYECEYGNEDSSSSSGEDTASQDSSSDGEDQDCDDGGACAITGCKNELTTCFFDEDCYNAVSYFFDDFLDGDAIGEWIEGQLSEGNSLDDDSFLLFLNEEFCSMDNIECNDYFYALATCLWDTCLSPMLPCYITECYQAMYACFDSDDCNYEGCLYFGGGNEDDCQQEQEERRRRRRRLQDDADDEAEDEAEDNEEDDVDIFDLDVPDYEGSGTQENRDEWTSEVYATSCDGDSTTCSEEFVNVIECMADACIFDTDYDGGDDSGGDGNADSADANDIGGRLMSTVVSFMVSALLMG